MILILTPYSFNPLHPRLEYVEKYLIKNGYKVKKINLNSKSRILNKLNWLTLQFFQIIAFFKSFKYLWNYKKKSKIIYIQDLQYLPIAIIARIFGKKVIYDTLDNNAELNFYHLSNRFKFFKKIIFIKKSIIFLEKIISKNFCDEIIVNSKALEEYFKPNRVNVIYYTSPFEKKFVIDYDNKNIAFIYLGGFWKMKGADIILENVEKYNKKLFIFGTLNQIEKGIKDKVEELQKKNLLEFHKRVSSVELKGYLESILKDYKLIGFSLTKEVNKSNATQEINKDIDYLSMGIPLIANYRKPTAKKIVSGCGVFVDDLEGIESLFTNKNYYKSVSQKCINYYNKYYAQNIFEKKLLKVVKNV